MKPRLKRILIALALLILGFVFSMTVTQWIHGAGHIFGAIITGTEIKGVKLIPPWQEQVGHGEFPSVAAAYIFFLGGFLLTFFVFLIVFAVTVFRKSKIIYFMLFPFFQTFSSSQGDLAAIGLYIPDLVAYSIFGWSLPIIAFIALLVFYDPVAKLRFSKNLKE